MLLIPYSPKQSVTHMTSFRHLAAPPPPPPSPNINTCTTVFNPISAHALKVQSGTLWCIYTLCILSIEYHAI